MSYYTTFITKELRLRTDTPKEVIEFINCPITPKLFVPNRPAHKFFTMERWDSLFFISAFHEETPYYFKKVGENYRLRVACEINYEAGEIEQFVNWITPYVIGHKPKEYIGYFQKEGSRKKVNVYIHRVGVPGSTESKR